MIDDIFQDPVGETEYFLVEIGLHQGFALSRFIFVVILDEISRGIQRSVPWCMLFPENIMLVVEFKVEVNKRLDLEQWKVALESQGVHICLSKTEYLWCNFSECIDDGVKVNIGEGGRVPQNDSFKCPCSIIQKRVCVGEDDIIVNTSNKDEGAKAEGCLGVLCCN